MAYTIKVGLARKLREFCLQAPEPPSLGRCARGKAYPIVL